MTLLGEDYGFRPEKIPHLKLRLMDHLVYHVIEGKVDAYFINDNQENVLYANENSLKFPWLRASILVLPNEVECTFQRSSRYMCNDEKEECWYGHFRHLAEVLQNDKEVITTRRK